MEEKRRKSVDVTVKDVFAVFWRHMKPYKRWVITSLFLLVVISAIEVVTPLFYKFLIDSLSDASVLLSDRARTAFYFLLAIIGFSIIENILRRVEGFLASAFEPKIAVDLHSSALAAILDKSYRFFTDTFSGSLVRRVNRFVGAYENIYGNVKWMILPLILYLIGVLFVVFQKSAIFGFAILAWTLVILVFNIFFSRWKMKTDILRAKVDSELGGRLADIVSNHLNVSLFTSRKHEEAGYRKLGGEWALLQVKSWRLAEMNWFIQGILNAAIELFVLYFAIRYWSEGRITVGDFVLLQAYQFELFGNVRRIGYVMRALYEDVADAKEMVESLKERPEVRDARGAKELRVRRGKIEYQNVTFDFGKERRVLDGFSFTIAPKEKIAFVGPSGAGKTTAVKLLLRFFDVTRGVIHIDGQDIAKVTQESLRKKIAFVPQEPVLFHRSLMDNIRYGRADASDDEVVDAAIKAHCHEFISELPEGYGTKVGERGVKLSGGERQRVAIARAILKDAPILVLDEATSSLDSASEAYIQDALGGLMKDKTVIAIAHRLSTIMKMDRIAVIEGGRVVDSGSHNQLLKKVGVYSTLWEIQAGGFRS